MVGGVWEEDAGGEVVGVVVLACCCFVIAKGVGWDRVER